MKKNDGMLRRAAGYASERNASSTELFDSLFELELATRDMKKHIARSESRQKETDELDALVMQMNLHPPGSPEHEQAEKRFNEIIERVQNPQPEPAGFGQKMTELLLRLKYDVLHMLSMILTLLLVVVLNVAALAGLIYFLPTILEWLF